MLTVRRQRGLILWTRRRRNISGKAMLGRLTTTNNAGEVVLPKAVRNRSRIATVLGKPLNNAPAHVNDPFTFTRIRDSF